MTATSQIIYDAFRQSNLIALTATLTDAQQDEALRYLNRLVKSVFGNEVSEMFNNIPIGRQNINAPVGYPWRNHGNANWFVPKDTRLLLNLQEPRVFNLDPAPDDGTRFAFIDTAMNLAEFPITINGNGRMIDGVFSVTYNTNGASNEWFYRDDLGSWMSYAPLIINPDLTPPLDTLFPFPEEFDDFFITMLAMRLNPTYGSQIDQQSTAMLQRASKQLKARYTQHRFVGPENAVVRLADVAADRQQWGLGDTSNGTAEFNSGRPRIGI